MVVLCAVLAPPPLKTKELPRSKKYYTIHSHHKDVFGVRVEDDKPTLMVGFKNEEDALLMGRMLETYYKVTDELPLATTLTNFRLPAVEESVAELDRLFVLHNDAENLLSWCTINFLDFLGVEAILESDSGKYAWDVSIYRAEPEFEMCKERFGYLYDL